MKTAVIYARYSSERQTEQSIEGQLRICYQFAEQNDIVIVDTYIDRAMTGKNDKRTDFQRMLRDSNKRAWDIVLVYKIDRFGRNKYEIAVNKHTLKVNGIRLLSATENIPDTPEGIILESLLEGMAEYYSAELSQKVLRGMNETRLKGNYTGGYIPYGYKKDGKKLVIDEDEAKIVRWIFDQYAKGVYVKDIIAELMDKGLTLRGRRFAKNTIHHMLQCEKYSGIYTLRGEVYTNLYPKIVPDEIFQKVKTKNMANSHGCHKRTVVYLLRKKLFCGYCGRAINGTGGTSRKGKQIKYYACSGVYLKLGCKKKTFRKDMLEDIVLQAVMRAFEDDGAFDTIAESIYNVNKARLEDQSVYKLLCKQQKQIQSSIDNLMAAIEKGVVTASTKRRLEQLDEQNDTLLSQMAIEKSKTKMTITKTDIARYLRKALSESPERVIDLLVKKIVVYDDKIEIYCNYCDKKGPDDESLGLLLYTENASISQYVQETGETVTLALKVSLLA